MELLHIKTWVKEARQHNLIRTQLSCDFITFFFTNSRTKNTKEMQYLKNFKLITLLFNIKNQPRETSYTFSALILKTCGRRNFPLFTAKETISQDFFRPLFHQSTPSELLIHCRKYFCDFFSFSRKYSSRKLEQTCVAGQIFCFKNEIFKNIYKTCPIQHYYNVNFVCFIVIY